jgi:hypothetical protein
MKPVRLALGLVLLLLPLACGDSPFKPTDPNNLVSTGTVQFLTFEGGFWAIQADDGVTYEPRPTLTTEFQRNGLRVRFEAKILGDAGGIRMAGPIVEIVQIRKL